MSARADKPMRILQSPLTGQYYAFQSYKLKGNVVVVTGQKWDVTDDVRWLIELHLSESLEPRATQLESSGAGTRTESSPETKGTDKKP